MEKLLKVDETAKILNIGRSKAYEMIAEGQIPSVRIGRSVRVPPEGLRRKIEEMAEE
jgi:excisionase family DNA binding protein